MLFEDETNKEEKEEKSIFNMSDEELYDDVKKETRKSKSPMKKSTRNMIILIVVTCVALIMTVVALFWGVSEHRLCKQANDNYAAAVAKNKEYDNKIAELNNEIDSLNAKIKEIESAGAKEDSDKTYPTGTIIQITEEGHNQGVRTSASVDAESSGAVYWGEKYTLLQDAILDANGNYWAKISLGYIRITYNGEVWATVAE